MEYISQAHSLFDGLDTENLSKLLFVVGLTCLMASHFLQDGPFKFKKKWILALIAVLNFIPAGLLFYYTYVGTFKFPSLASGDYVGIDTANIVRAGGYSQVGNGDYIFLVKPKIMGCNGLWIRSSDAGFETTKEIVSLAFQTGQSVSVYGEPQNLWKGSKSDNYCHLYAISVFKED